MKTRLWTIIVGATLSMGLPDTLTADVIYSNFGPGDTFNTTYSWGIGAFYSGTNPNVGASFKVGPADMLFDSGQVAFLGSISGTNSLTLGIYSNSSDNLPGTLLQSFTLTNIPHAPNAPTVVTFSATGPLRLSANTTYWLASDEHDTDLFGWHWNSTSQLGVAFRLGFDPWFVSSTDLTPAFRINGTPISVTSTTGVIYAATTNGVFKSTNGGASWTAANTGLSGLSGNNALSLAIDPFNRATLYAGTFGNGVFKSIDGAQSWIPSSFGLIDSFVLAIAIDPANPSTIYSGTARRPFLSTGGGVFRSTDGGQSWSVSNSGLPDAIIGALRIDPSNTAVVYAGTNFDGVFKSTNGGVNWTAANSGTSSYISDIAVDPTNSVTVYAAGCSFNCSLPGGSLFKSTNGGMSWTGANQGITDSLVVSLAVDQTNPNILYAGTRLDGVFKSINAGTNWSPVNSGLQSTPFGSIHLPLVSDPSNPRTVYAGTLNGVFKSTDGGATWSSANIGFPPSTSILALAIDPVLPTIAGIITNIENLGLNSGEKSSLMSKLRAAERSLGRGADVAAKNQLSAFIHEIRALQHSGRLDVATASSLIAAVQAIIDAI